MYSKINLPKMSIIYLERKKKIRIFNEVKAHQALFKGDHTKTIIVIVNVTQQNWPLHAQFLHLYFLLFSI